MYFPKSFRSSQIFVQKCSCNSLLSWIQSIESCFSCCVVWKQIMSRRNVSVGAEWKGRRVEVEEREAARDNDTEEPGIMGWFTRCHKLWRNQLAPPPLTTRSCSELSSRRSSDDKLCGSGTDCDTLFFVPSS